MAEEDGEYTDPLFDDVSDGGIFADKDMLRVGWVPEDQDLPRAAAAARNLALAVVLPTDDALILVVIALVDGDAEAVALIALVGARGREATSSTV